MRKPANPRVQSVMAARAAALALALFLLGGAGVHNAAGRNGGSAPSWWGYETGRSYVSKSGYIEYVAGDAPLIISAPHGGLLEPSHIPDRSGVVEHDAHTLELARLYADAYFELTGRRPHLIINRLHRKKLDANRDLAEAAEGHPEAAEAWREFHAYIEEAKAVAVATYGWGLYVDLHGQSHAHQRVELGYGISAEELRLSDDVLNRPEFWAKTTLRPWCPASGDPGGLAALLRGPTSLGALLERHGAPSVPSGSEPFPRPGWGYFSGGYNVKRHGARDGGPVGAVQIEVSSNWRRSRESRLAFARILAQATAEFLAHHAGGGVCGPQIRVWTVDREGRRSALARGAVLAGEVRFEIEIVNDDGAEGRVNASLRPASSGGGEAELGGGAGRVLVFDVDTRALKDGMYDLVVTARTQGGGDLERAERIEIDNWNVLEDPLLPPAVGGWIGTVEMIKAVARSGGWEHATDRPEDFGGDAHRLALRPGGSGSLVWKLDHLRSFEVVLYASAPTIDRAVVISVSADGERWTDLAYASQAEPAREGMPHKVVITGPVPEELEASFFRLAVSAGEEDGLLEVGHVRLVGASEHAARAGVGKAGIGN